MSFFLTFSFLFYFLSFVAPYWFLKTKYRAYSIPGKNAQIVKIRSIMNSVPNPHDKNAETGGKKIAEGEG